MGPHQGWGKLCQCADMFSRTWRSRMSSSAPGSRSAPGVIVSDPAPGAADAAAAPIAVIGGEKHHGLRDFIRGAKPAKRNAAGDDFRRSAPVGEEASRSFKPGVSATPAPCWRRSVEQLATLSAWATEHRFESNAGYSSY
jgi:hypothetical protein